MPDEDETFSGFFSFGFENLMMSHAHCHSIVLNCLYCKYHNFIYTVFIFSKINLNRYLTPSNMEQGLCWPLAFNQSTTNMQSFPLNSSKFA